MKQVKRIQSIEVKRMYDQDPDTSYLEQEEFADRLHQYQNGDFAFIGIQAKAEVMVDGICQTITSGGLWGIEDDSDESYLRDVEQEELGALRGQLYQLGFSKRAIATAVKEMC